MKKIALLLYFLVLSACIGFCQPESTNYTCENSNRNFDFFYAKTQKKFNKKFKNYCKKYLIHRYWGCAYFGYLTFSIKQGDLKNEKIKIAAERIRNVIADTNFCLEHRLSALQIIDRNFYKENAIAIDTIAGVQILMQTFLTDSSFTNWGEWTKEWTHPGVLGHLLVYMGQDKAINSLFAQLNNTKKTVHCCYSIDFTYCMKLYHLHTARYCDYAAVYLARIVNMPYTFQQNPIEDDKKIEKLKLYVKAYCAERGIKLE